jgi:hypothetical protein
MSIARPIQSHRALVETCRQRADELAISRLELDRLAGLTEGYSGKLLGNGKGKDPKRMWTFAFEAMLGALGLQVILIEDPAATARTLALRTPVDRLNQRFENHWRNSMPQLCIESSASVPIEVPKVQPPIVSRAHLRVVQSKRRGSKYG